MMAIDLAPPPGLWRNNLSVHPAADLFPILNERDLVTLGEDIKRSGLSSPVAIRIEKGKLRRSNQRSEFVS